MVEVHVGEAALLVVDADAKVFVDRRPVVVLIRGQARRRVTQAGGRDEVVEQPEVTPVPVVGVALEVEAAAQEAEADLLAHDLGPTITHRSR